MSSVSLQRDSVKNFPGCYNYMFLVLFGYIRVLELELILVSELELAESRSIKESFLLEITVLSPCDYGILYALVFGSSLIDDISLEAVESSPMILIVKLSPLLGWAYC